MTALTIQVIKCEGGYLATAMYLDEYGDDLPYNAIATTFAGLIKILAEQFGESHLKLIEG